MCVNDDYSLEVTDSESSCEDKMNDFMLMAIEDLEGEYAESDMNDEDAVVDMQGELISVLEEIDRLRLKKRKQKKLLMQSEKNVKEPNVDCILLKVELEEAKKISDVLKEHFSQKNMRCEALEEDVVKFRKELEKFQSLYPKKLSSIKAS